MTWCATRQNVAAEHKTISNMISFGVMTVLLAVLACVVHYDLFGLFPYYPYGRHARDERRQQHQQQQQQPGREEPRDDKRQNYEPVARSAFDDAWLPRPGTDPHTLFQRPTIVVHDYGDYRPADGRDDYWMDDDYWTDGEEEETAMDDDESWTKVTTADDGDEDDGRARGAAGSEYRPAGAGDTCRAPVAATSEGCIAESTAVGVEQPAPESSSRPFDDGPEDGYEYDEDYMAPGEERDDDVF